MISREDQIQKLYKERASFADMESDFQEMKQWVPYDGIRWKVLNWLEKQARLGRESAQQELDELVGGSRDESR